MFFLPALLYANVGEKPIEIWKKTENGSHIVAQIAVFVKNMRIYHIKARKYVRKNR